MDIPRGPSYTIPVLRRKSGHFEFGPQRLSLPTGPMTVPNHSREANAPPALPPPRYIEDLADGHDLAWNLQNSHHEPGHDFRSLVKPGSSLLGEDQLMPKASRKMDLDAHRNQYHRLPSPEQATSRAALATRDFAPTSITNLTLSDRVHKFQSEQPLAQQNQHESTQAYDQRLLSKIGRGTSPTTRTRPPPLRHTTAHDGTHYQPHPSPKSSALRYDRDVEEPVMKWLTTPTSPSQRSPTQIQSQHEHSPNPPSPSEASSSYATVPRLTMPSDRLLSNTSLAFSTFSIRKTDSNDHSRRTATSGERSGSQLRLPNGSASPSFSETNPYHEHGSAEMESISDDTTVDDSVIRDRPAAHKNHGMKRRALSPSEDAMSISSMRSLERLSSIDSSAMIDARNMSKHGSISSTTSSIRQNSYTPSMFSAAPSSMTSLTSLDTRSPLEPLQSSPYITSARITASPTSAMIPLRKIHDKSKPTITPKSTPQNSLRISPSENRIVVNKYMCSCCPKKPKKFDSEELLRIHENEKQYQCAYCPHRFKNKNEAERHQNSLHLRKHSWSCGAIDSYQDMFYSPAAAEFPGTAFDLCSYCGAEFTNHPKSWEDRLEHLTNIHKFGECNATKKFFRADHFRQHLKHSHGGKSGRWTNVIENVCVRDELLPESPGVTSLSNEQI